MTAVPSALLEQLAGSGGAVPSLESYLETVDPRTRMLAQLLTNMRSDSSEAVADDSHAAEAAAREARMRRRMRAMREELECLRELNDAVSAALGACHLCWGRALDCLHCGGGGAPGGMEPDRALFEQLILPAVRRLNRDRVRTADSVDPSQVAEQAERRSA